MCHFDKNIVDLHMQTSYITEHYPKLQSKHQKEKKKKIKNLREASYKKQMHLCEISLHSEIARIKGKVTFAGKVQQLQNCYPLGLDVPNL